MRVGIIGGSIAGCATAALLDRAGHDVVVFERSESDLVSRGAGIAAPTAVWQDMMAHGLIDATLPACRADYFRFVTRGSGTGQQRWLGDVQMCFTLLNWAHLYIPGSGQSTERGKRLLMWGYYLQVPESALASVLVDDQERQQSSSVPFGKVHPEVKAGFESRLADLLPSLLFELVQQCGNSSIQAVYSVAASSYARDRVCLAGDAGAVFPPFAGSGVLRAVANATSLADALAGCGTVAIGRMSPSVPLASSAPRRNA